MIVSTISSGEGSVGVSARPALPTIISTSGNCRSTALRAFRSSATSVTDARGTVTGMSRMLPSSNAGMYSRPSLPHKCQPSANSTMKNQFTVLG